MKYSKGKCNMGKIVKVELPIRINFGGAWSDTPPFCIKEGGCVCNGSAIINGERPVKVTIEEISEDKIILQNENSILEINEIADLEKEGDIEFNLLKKTLILVKIKHKNFKIKTDTKLIPRGSGLGTSSILILAILQAIYEYENIYISEDELINKVLEVEKMIETGGGWQDQAGAIRSGIKLLTSNPGEKQELKIETIEIPTKAKEELKERFVLVYTGNTRNSGDIVKEIMDRYLKEEKQKEKINSLKNIAIEMKKSLEKGDIEGFARNLSKNYEISKTLSSKIENEKTKEIFEKIENMISGKMICGAGNGGFLEIVLKKNVTKKKLQEVLDKYFSNSEIKIWEIKLE